MREIGPFMYDLCRLFQIDNRCYMPIVEEQYDQNRVDGVRRSLQRESDKGKPRDFEIFVDGFKIVPRTNNIEEFDEYEQEIRDTTRNVSFLLYDGPVTNRNTKYLFNFQREGTREISQPATLGEIDKIVAQKLTERDKDYELSRLREKLEETGGKLEEAEEYAEQLQTRITELEKSAKGRMLNLGDLGASILMGVLRSNPHILPGGAGGPLAGFLKVEEGEVKQDSNSVQPSEGQASYSKGERYDSQTQGRLALLEQMQQKLDERQMVGVLNILGYLGEHPEKINTVIELLETEN